MALFQAVKQAPVNVAFYFAANRATSDSRVVSAGRITLRSRSHSIAEPTKVNAESVDSASFSRYARRRGE